MRPPKPRKQKDPTPRPGVEPGDHVYFQHRDGPKHGKVLAHGRHGATIEGPDGNHHQVHWPRVLGHRERMQHRMEVVDRGEDGAIVKDEKGRQRFLAGEVPGAEGYADQAAKVEPAADGELVSRRIEQVMRKVPVYQVLAGEMPDGTVLVTETGDDAVTLLSALEQASLTVPYEARAATTVRGRDEEHGVLLVFAPDDQQLQPLINAVANHQRQRRGTLGDALIVFGKKVNSMRQAQVSAGRIGGRAVLALGEVPGLDVHEASVSPDMAEDGMTKSMVLFLKAGKIANRPGLALQVTNDSAGHQVKRWKRTGAEEKGQGRRRALTPSAEHEPRGAKRGYGTHHIEPGDSVKFESKDTAGAGKIVALGNDGATVKDADGREHKVIWSEIRHHRPGGGSAGAKKVAHETEPVVLGKQDPIPAESFVAADYAKSHDQAGVNVRKIMAQFLKDAKEKIAKANKRLYSIEQTIDKFQKDGKWVKERELLHRKIIGEILSPEIVKAAKPADGDKPVFMILGGRGGSGKSSLKGQVYDPDKSVVLDADRIKDMLPEYEGWNALQVHEESGEIFDYIASKVRELGLNTVLDKTMKTAKSAIADVQSFKDAGYRTEAHYMHLPRQESAKRAVHRFLDGGKKGRYVSVNVILKNTTNEAAFDHVKDMVDAWSFRDNNVPRGQAPILISEGGSGLKKSHGVAMMLLWRKQS